MKIQVLAALLFLYPLLLAQDVAPPPVPEGLAAQTVAQPPKPADNGPSLADTMKFIQDKLNEVGKVNFISYVHDGKTGDDWTNNHTYEIGNVRANAATCRVDFHFLALRDGVELVNRDIWLLAGAVQEVQVLTAEQDDKHVDTANGHPEWSDRDDPPVFVLNVKRPGNVNNSFWFFDESMANRVAKALVHAVELCGGGNKDPF